MRFRGIKVGLVTAVVAVCSSFALAAPAHASTCNDFLGPDFSREEEICATVARVICGVIDKDGSGCLG